jgi:hypothetical protein
MLIRVSVTQGVTHASQIFVALFEMMLASLYILILVEIRVLMLMVNLLIFLIHFMSYLSLWLHACYLFMVSSDDLLLFCKSCHND